MDDLLYARLPGLHGYSHVYIVPVRWTSSRALEYQISAHGPVKEGLPVEKNMTVKIDL